MAAPLVDLPRPVEAGRGGWPWQASPDSTALASDAAALPLITIVTPSFNQAGYVEASIRSVLLQEYPRLEYIVMDGGSTDGSVEIIRRYESHLTHSRIGADSGQSDALRRGFGLANGDVLAWLNSDDLLLPGTLHRVGRAFFREPDMETLVGGTVIIDEQGLVVRNVLGLPRIVRGQRETFESLLLRRGLTFYQAASFWRSSAYAAVGGLDPTLEFAMDYDLFLRLARRRPLRHLDRLLAAYRVHPRSKTRLLHSVYERELSKLFRKYGGGAVSPRRSDMVRAMKWISAAARNLPVRVAAATGRIKLPVGLN